jgi:hypothetical protein
MIATGGMSVVSAIGSAATGNGGTNVSGGDSDADNEIIAPAAMVTLLDASTCVACMAAIVGTIHGDEMTSPARNAAIGIMVPM